MGIRYLHILLLAGTTAVGLSFPSWAQKAARRYEIDAKRLGVVPTDRDALPRGREFVRIDSTYYIGWMYQGLYLHDRAADFAGYQRALPMLRKAFLLIEKDFGAQLTTLYSDPMVYMQNNQRYNDYVFVVRALREAYENLDMPDSAMWALEKAERKKFKRDFIGLYGAKAWIIHRNRFYDSKRFPFLKNSVEENEQLALRACYQGFANIQRNLYQNNEWFGDFHSYIDRQYIYHYLALIHSYLKNYDSATYYYNQMADAGMVSWNNFGSLKAETGYFAEATEMYGRDRYKYGGLKQLMEPFYYLPLLKVYAAQTDEAATIAKEAITYSNSSPGFGWYNIALARAYLYNGQYDSAWLTLDKASRFQEVHIGTTLTQPQYDFTIGLLKLVWFHQKIASLKFLRKDWWYHPSVMYELAVLESRKYLHEYLLANQLALNPERERIVYELFCGESTVSFDEIYYLMERFSPGFFAKTMEQYAKSDVREKVKPYFLLYQARLLRANKQKEKADELARNILQSARVDTMHERLFIGRLYQLLWQRAAEQSNRTDARRFGLAMYRYYPNLVPSTGWPFAVNLQLKGATGPFSEKVMGDIRRSQLVVENAADLPLVLLNTKSKGIKHEVLIEVFDPNGKLQVRERFLAKEAEGVAEEIILRIFGKKGPLELEPLPIPKKTKTQ
jgi:hypothetical protein